MTAIAVPDASDRGCPSIAAGTTCRRDTSQISPYVLPGTTRCRTDRSGLIVGTEHLAHPYGPSATIPSHSRSAAESRIPTLKPSNHADNLSPEPSPVLPIGARRAFPSLSVSAPNSSPKYNLSQNGRGRGAGRRPRRRDPSRPVQCSRLCDVSTFPAKWNHCAATGQRLKVGRRCRRVLAADVRVEHVPTSPNRSCRCPHHVVQLPRSSFPIL